GDVKDVTGQPFVPFTSTFTTGSTPTGTPTPTSIAFDRVTLPTTGGRKYTAVTMGPDNRLYAATLEGLILRFPVNADGTLGSTPLNVKTKDGGGSYDPFAAGVALTIFAQGVRNAYDLVWHSNGNLYAPTNGSAAGGNTPLDPKQAGTKITNVRQTEHDWLF